MRRDGTGSGSRQLTASILAAAVVVSGVPSAMAANVGVLPASFIGEAAVVAFAFTLPALTAAVYLLVQRIWQALGSRLVIALVTLTAVGGVVLVAIGMDPQGAGRMLGFAGS